MRHQKGNAPVSLDGTGKPIGIRAVAYSPTGSKIMARMRLTPGIAEANVNTVLS